MGGIAVSGVFAKNTAVDGFPFYLENRTTGAPITSGDVVIYTTVDDGSQTTIAGDGAAAHKGNGQWTVDLTAAEMNGDVIGLLITHADACPQQAVLKTDVAWNSAWDAEVQSEVTDALNAAVTEDYVPTTGDASITQLLYSVFTFLVMMRYEGTQGTGAKRDAVSPQDVFQVTLDNASNPTELSDYTKL